MSRLTAGFIARPFAHRGLHDGERSENGMAAILAAAGAGYGIECDIQPRGDGTPMVFHDYDLGRLIGEEGRIAETPAPALAGMRLRSGEPIPTLAEVLEAVDGRVPILVEIKDQDGAFGPDVGPLDREVATLCTAYCARHGADALAVMSFNPHSVGWFAKHAPELRRGLVSYDYADEELDEGYRARLADCAFFDEVGADFVSYGATSFPSTAVAALRARGVPILTWTIRSEAAAEAALAHCDQITFENYRPDPRS